MNLGIRRAPDLARPAFHHCRTGSRQSTQFHGITWGHRPGRRQPPRPNPKACRCGLHRDDQGHAGQAVSDSISHYRAWPGITKTSHPEAPSHRGHRIRRDPPAAGIDPAGRLPSVVGIDDSRAWPGSTMPRSGRDRRFPGLVKIDDSRLWPGSMIPGPGQDRRWAVAWNS